MDEKVIGEIVRKTFEKARKEHVSHSRFALSKHIGDHSGLSSKTLERAYDRYVGNKKKHGALQAESVDLLCVYLGYQNFADYREKQAEQAKKEDDKKEEGNDGKESGVNTKRIALIAVAILAVVVCSIILIKGNSQGDINTSSDQKTCMTWADTLYIVISCDQGPYSIAGTDVLPYRDYDFKNLKKVKVHAAYDFFTEKNEPLIWYSKNKDDDIEYFTAPGLHPVTRKTLKAITPYIIQKYVPLHSNDSNSFIK